MERSCLSEVSGISLVLGLKCYLYIFNMKNEWFAVNGYNLSYVISSLTSLSANATQAGKLALFRLEVWYSITSPPNPCETNIEYFKS